MAAPARFPYDRGKAVLAAGCQDRKGLVRVTNCLLTNDDKMTLEPRQNWISGQSHARPQTPIPHDRGRGSAPSKMELSWNGGPPQYQGEPQASSTVPLPSPPLAPLLSRMVGPISGESQHNTSTEANSYSSHGTLAQDATILTVNDYIFLINRTGVFFTAGREQEPGITMLISIPCSRHGEEQCARGDLEAGKHMIPVSAPAPNKTSFPYDPGGGSIVRGTEHGMPAVLRSYRLISESAASHKQVLGSQNKDFVLVDIREGLERCEVIAVSEQKSFEDVQQTKGDSSEISTSWGGCQNDSYHVVWTRDDRNISCKKYSGLGNHSPCKITVTRQPTIWTFKTLSPVVVVYADLVSHWTRSGHNYAIMKKIFRSHAHLVSLLENKYLNRECIFLPDSGASCINYLRTSAMIRSGLELESHLQGKPLLALGTLKTSNGAVLTWNQQKRLSPPGAFGHPVARLFSFLLIGSTQSYIG